MKTWVPDRVHCLEDAVAPDRLHCLEDAVAIVEKDCCDQLTKTVDIV